MFDLETRPSSDPFGTPESLGRLRRRRWAETRLKAYGIVAILLAIAALAVLAWSVVSKTSAALTEHYVMLEVELPVDEVDPDQTGDPSVIGKADFVGITKDTLRARFPGVKGRKARRQLNDIVSVGAAYELRQFAMSDPSVVGTTIEFPFLASDIADLYFKGWYGRLDSMDKPEDVAVDVTEAGKDRWSIVAERPVFEDVVASLGEVLVERSERLQEQAALYESGRQGFEDMMRAAESDDEREDFRRRAASSAERRDRLLAEAGDLVAVARDGTRPVQLDRDMPTLALRTQTGWYRFESVSAKGAKSFHSRRPMRQRTASRDPSGRSWSTTSRKSGERSPIFSRSCSKTSRVTARCGRNSTGGSSPPATAGSRNSPASWARSRARSGR